MSVMTVLRQYLCLAVMLSGLAMIYAGTPRAVADDPVGAAETWFNGITTMKADFTQVASDGTTATGELHLRRPHRMKIIYDLDEPLILLTTPVWLHVDRPEDRRVTSYPIRETPLSLILKKEVKLRNPDFRTKHSMRNGITSIVLTKETGEGAGQLILEFTNEPFELRRWSIHDSVDVTTTVTLYNMRFGHSYENKFFAVNDYALKAQ